MAALLSLKEKKKHFVQGREILAEFTPKFQMGLFFENVLKPAVYHFYAFQLSLQWFIVSEPSSAKFSLKSDLRQRRQTSLKNQE